MSRYENTVFCDNCGVEITWAPVFHNEGEFCCRDCFEHRPCRCSERMEWDDERRACNSQNSGAGIEGGYTA
jgi:hypothetical protein